MKNENGFTMLEVLFAMAIFAVAMLGVIGLQLNALQTDEETRRKDMAAQLLTAGAEMVECTDYGATQGSDGLFRNDNLLPGTDDIQDLMDDVEHGRITQPWMTISDGKARLYLRHQVEDRDVDSDGDTDFSIRHVYLVAAWDSLTTAGQRKTLARVMVKPQNNLQ